MAWSGASCFMISTIRDALVPWSPGKPEAARWVSPYSCESCCLGQASLGRLRATCPWLQVLPALEESSPSFPIPCSEQTLHFAPRRRTGVCPDLRKALLRPLSQQAEWLCLIGESWAEGRARGACMWHRCPGQEKGQRNVTPLHRSRHPAGRWALSQALGTWGREAGAAQGERWCQICRRGS